MMPNEMDAQPGPVQVRGTVLTVRRVDAYHAMTLVAPAIAARFKPGQFITLAVGGPDSSMLLSRAFSIHDVRPDHGGTVEFVFAVHGRGTQWLAERRARDVLDVTGPLGRPFPLPRDPVNCLLIGGGYGSAPLFALASKLRERRCEVDFLIGAGSGDRVFGALTARRTGRSATITTEDGSLGARGLVTDMLDQVIHDGRTDVIYACGPMPMLRQVTALARRYDIPVQAAVEEAMACGVGVCMTCVLPVIGSDGITRMVRSCVDGPVFRGESVRWDDVGTIPFDAFGAPGWEPRSRRAAQLQNPGHADHGGNGAGNGLGPIAPAPDGAGGAVAARPAAGRAERPAGRRARARLARRAAGGRDMPVDLRTRLGHVELPNPIMTASGCAGAGRELAQFMDVSKIGAIVTKSVMLSPRSGRPTPRMAETPSGMLNSIGLQGPGIDAFLQRDLPWLLSRGARAVVSIAGGTVAEYADLAGRLSDAAGVTAIEVNISCPNVEHRGQVFACQPDSSAAVIEAVRARARYDIPVFAKLSPDVTDIVAIAKACVAAGADGLSMINTLLGMVIDTDTMRPQLAGLTGGLSGPAIRPVAVRCIWQVREALPGVPIIGMGGVRTGRDALELILAGASMVSVGTTIFHDPSACARILRELEEELTERGVERLADVVGLAHQARALTGRALSPNARVRRS